MTAIRRALDWMFRSRETGRVTVVQFPNVPLWVFFAVSIVGGIAHPSGTSGQIMSAVGTGALVVWAADEVLRGVNPWRRLLGVGMLTWEAVRLAAG